jgi:hypothetical protein
VEAQKTLILLSTFWGEVQKDLGAETASPLESLLIQQVVLCWLRLNVLEIHYTIMLGDNHQIATGLYYEKRLTAAQKRFTRACETLAKVRKLSRNTHALQVNIATNGGQQVNVSGDK